MVEMRWLAQNAYGEGKILQYRYAKEMDMSVVSAWSDWIDVPTVTEG